MGVVRSGGLGFSLPHLSINQYDLPHDMTKKGDSKVALEFFSCHAVSCGNLKLNPTTIGCLGDYQK